MTLSELQRTVVKEAYAAFFRDPTQAQKANAKELLQDPAASATAVMVAARHLLGPLFISWEPETLWLELDPCLANRDKLMAGVALAMTPSFYWDYRVFGATTHALNDEMVSPEEVPHCSPSQMAWATFEAELLFALTDGESTRPEYDSSVEAYVATSLFDDGLVTTPTGLGFAEEELKAKLGPEPSMLRGVVEKTWAALPKESLEQVKLEDNPGGVQLMKLIEPWLYVTEKTKRLRAELGKL